MDEKLEAWRQGSDRSTYKKGEYVRHNGRKFVCRENHYSTAVVEPGKGEFWPEYWDLIEEAPTTSAKDVSIQTEEVSFPPVDVSKRLTFETATDKQEWSWKGKWSTVQAEHYKCNDCVDSDGISYRSIYDHWPALNTEPGKGQKWEQVWQRLGRTKPEHQLKAEPKSQLIFAHGPALAGGEQEEIDLDRLKELVDSGECNIHFELKQPCKTIQISQMELVEIEETEEGTYFHMMVLRDMTEEENE